jgi:RES domain-containing protein
MPASQRKPRTLREAMRVYRIGDSAGRFPIFSGEGAVRTEGRWHQKGQDVIYASRHYSTALLEKLVHYAGTLPANQHFIEIEIPAGSSYEIVTKDSLPQWLDASKARAFGSRWFAEKRSLILIVPSVVARIECNVVVNMTHGEAGAVKPGLEQPVAWDARLFT